MEVIRYIVLKCGDVIDDTFFDLTTCAKPISEVFNIPLYEVKMNIRLAIENGNEYPEDSGYYYDWLFTESTYGQEELGL